VRRLFAFVLAGFSATAACSDQSTPGGSPPPVVVPPEAGADAAGAAEAGVSRRPGVIRVGTFNVHRYFDTVCDSGRCAAGDFEEAPSQATFDAVTTKLAKGIALIDPDVIALEEVETSRCLDALVAKLASLGKDFPIAHLGEIGTPGSVDVAILARGALTEIKTHRDTPIKEANGTTTTFSRELLEVRMTFGPKSVVMFAAHFRSQVADDPARRLAEAKAAQAIVSKVSTDLPDALVLLGGDLNDKPGSDPINALEMGGALLRVAKDVPPDDQATYVFQGVKSAIDHVFVGAPQAARYVAKSATAYRDDARGGFAGSDHAALAADFSIE
jgi:predicted extracellular nuclease